MIYQNEILKQAMSVARHAYRNEINSRGQLLYLQAFNDLLPGISEKEMAIHLLKKALEETALSVEGLRDAQLDDEILEALITDIDIQNQQRMFA